MCWFLDVLKVKSSASNSVPLPCIFRSISTVVLHFKFISIYVDISTLSLWFGDIMESVISWETHVQLNITAFTAGCTAAYILSSFHEIVRVMKTSMYENEWCIWGVVNVVNGDSPLWLCCAELVERNFFGREERRVMTFHAGIFVKDG